MKGREPNGNVARWRGLAEFWVRRTGCPPALILAVIEQESGGNPDAVRYEPEYEERYRARCAEVAAAAGIEVSRVASSYGLMQLMLPLAWGYMGAEQRRGDVVAVALDPEQNVRFGAAHLGALIGKELTRRTDAVSRALGAGREIDGSVVRSVAGRFNGAGCSSVYAKNVCSLWRRWGEWLKGAVEDD